MPKENLNEIYEKTIPDFIDQENWQLVEMELNRTHWRSINGARVELFPYFLSSYWEDVFPAVVVRPDGKNQNFVGEDSMERAWAVAEMFRKQEQ